MYVFDPRAIPESPQIQPKMYTNEAIMDAYARLIVHMQKQVLIKQLKSRNAVAGKLFERDKRRRFYLIRISSWK